VLDYKQKYKELRAKLLESTDVAYRLGFEEGLKEGELLAQQQMQQQQMAMQQAAMQGGGQIDPQTGEPLPPEEGGGEMPPEMAAQEGGVPPEMMGEEAGSELDQHIGELEGLVSKGEKPTVLAMRETVAKLTDLRKSQKEQIKKKGPQIASAQKKLVDGILKKWEKEANEPKAKENIEQILKDSELIDKKD
jgi:hypothetical protein